MVKHFVQQPLPTSFMLVSIIGFLFSVFVVWEYSLTWGFTFTFMFALWFIASVYNFTHAPVSDHLDIHDSTSHARKSKAVPLKHTPAQLERNRGLAVLFAFVAGGLSLLYTKGKNDAGLLVGYIALLVITAVGRSLILRPGGAEFYTTAVFALVLAHLGFMLYQALRDDSAYQ